MRDVKGYEGLYGITSCGKVWSYKNERFLKPYANNNGYLGVALSKNGKAKQFLVHRLVAEAYIPNPNNLPQVDHIDNDKTHNYVNNLQWITGRDNVRKGRIKPILQFDLNGNFIREWESAIDVGREVRSNICMCLKGKYKQALGYIWRYKESEV